MEDAQIIELFFARSEDAISELDKKYGKLCHKLADNILASAQDAEECVNDAYLAPGTRSRRSVRNRFRVCRHARPPLFDHALSCQHGNETKQPLRYVHGGA